MEEDPQPAGVTAHTPAASPPRAAHHSATPTARPAAWQSRASLVRHRTAPRSTCRVRPAPCAAPPAEGAPHAAGRSQTRARSTRAVSISSLALHASMPDYFLVVAPPATRVETQSACDIKRPTVLASRLVRTPEFSRQFTFQHHSFQYVKPSTQVPP